MRKNIEIKGIGAVKADNDNGKAITNRSNNDDL
jgi:hypothetical protein